jgi:hypothetical protein
LKKYIIAFTISPVGVALNPFPIKEAHKKQSAICEVHLTGKTKIYFDDEVRFAAKQSSE